MLAHMHERLTSDVGGQFSIIDHVARAELHPQAQPLDADVTLASQCTLSQLHHVSFLAHRWAAPLSLAVFVMPGDVMLAVAVIAGLRHCQPLVRRHVDFHLVLPALLAPPGSEWKPEPINCLKASRLLHSLKIAARNYGEQKIAYPNNLLRNVDRRYAHTDLTFVTDIDMVPSVGLRDAFIAFWSEAGNSVGEDKLVYVVPAYEIAADVKEEDIPADKRQLLDRVRKQEARPFYMELCWKCQKVTGYAAWEAHDDTSPLLRLSTLHRVQWRDPWEPFFISRNDVPLYDERFTQYGFNRMSQVCETHVAGYDFVVLNNAFLLHRGLKRSDSFHADKELDQERNRILFREFKSLLSSKYPGSARSCS